MVYLVRKTAYFKIASSQFIIYCFILFGNLSELRLNIRRLQYMYTTYCSYLNIWDLIEVSCRIIKIFDTQPIIIYLKISN